MIPKQLKEIRKEFFDNMDFYHNRVKCSKIKRLVPTLNKMVEEELRLMP